MKMFDNPIQINTQQIQRLLLGVLTLSLLLASTPFVTAADATLSNNNKVCSMACADGATRNGVIAGGQPWTQSGCQRAADAFCADHGGVAAGYPKLGGLIFAEAHKEIYRNDINTGNSPLPLAPAYKHKSNP